MKQKIIMTSYARMTPGLAFVILSTFLTAEIVFVLRPGDVRTIRVDNLVRELNDSLAYRAIAGRVHAGQGYYDAAAIELSGRGYPTQSVFNWRFPTYALIFGKLPDQSWGRFILEISILSAIGMASALAARDFGVRMAIAIAASLITADAWIAFPEPIYFTEFWAGNLILISLYCNMHNQWLLGLAAGSTALVLRELSLPYCLVIFAFACHRRRWREVAFWIAVLAAYTVLFFLHYLEAKRRGAGLATGQVLTWIALGGQTSIISTLRMNLLLSLLPIWVTAIYVPLAILGLLGWPSRNALPMKVTAVIYLAMLSVIGQPFDFYWGWLITPIISIGIVWAPMAIRDLVLGVIKIIC